MKYYVFGSKSSQDLDILVLVDQLGTIAENKEKVVQLQKDLVSISPKPVNVNLGVLKDGTLTKVFKGTLDEVNNSVMDTYGLHEQFFPLDITVRQNRDITEKALRAVRICLSNLSRTQYRGEVKQGLRGDVLERVKVLQNINLTTVTSHDKYPVLDLYKTLAFQMGQALGLMQTVELYTKEAISSKYSLLEPYLMRQVSSLKDLEDYKNMFCQEILNYSPKLTSLTEKVPE